MRAQKNDVKNEIVPDPGLGHHHPQNPERGPHMWKGVDTETMIQGTKVLKEGINPLRLKHESLPDPVRHHLTNPEEDLRS